MDEKDIEKPAGGAKTTSDGGGDKMPGGRNGPSALLTKFLPPWFTDNLHDKRTWKTLVRCWVSTFSAFILLLPDKSLRTLGNS